ncbi:hypothetical protein ACE418_01030 [Megasphaera sp. WILCCON 0056]|uniref:crAss001_48 related protein n=1 Tax=Megasphaera sp. WILCCON 0056 TaxID=3345340 RepID=UPI003A7FC642
MKDYIYRMVDERCELSEKWVKLEEYLNKHSSDLDATERYLMTEQSEVMDKYKHILSARIVHALQKEEQKENE